MKTYETYTLPRYVIRYLGNRLPEMFRTGPGSFLLVGATRGLMVHAETADEARAAASDAVSHLSPATDRRRKVWKYT